MNVRRSWSVFLVMLVIAACGVALAAEKPITESWNALHGVPDGCDWQCVGAGSGKLAAVAGWRGDELTLRYFTTDGAFLREQRAALPEELAGGTVSRLLPAQEGLCYLGIYGPNAEKLYLYRIRENGEAERLLAADCEGESFAERSQRTRLSEFLLEDDILSFALWTDDRLDCYLCRESGGLEAAGSGECESDRVFTVLADQNGALLQGGSDLLSMNGTLQEGLVDGQTVTHLTQGRGGWYYLDADWLDVCFVDAAFGESYRLHRLQPTWNGEPRSLRSVALTREESSLVLLDGTILTVTDAQGTRELAGALHPKAAHLWFTFVKYAALAVAAALLLWLLLCGLRRGYASLAVIRGSLLLAAALLCLTALRFGVLLPETQAAALQQNEAVAAGLLHTARAESRLADASLAEEACRLLEGADETRGRNVRAVLARQIDGEWRASDGRLAVTLDGFSPALADAAAESGRAGALQGGAFSYALAANGRCLCVRVENPLQTQGGLLYAVVAASYVLLAVLALLVLLSIGIDLRRIAGRMESISRGSVPEPLWFRTGDELESMASIVNSLGVSLKAQEERQESLERSYRRFVPEKVLALLGKQSIQEVDKSAFAARRMAVMTVRFAFPDALYTKLNNSRLLFDSVNEVIERTAAIVARKGGTVFRFAYNGFDVVMDEGGEAVSTAVAIQQEVLSFNELRARDSLPGVTLRIALDEGDVMLGIVGDATQMEPATISSSLSTVQELIRLCNRLNAGILCTEAILSEGRESGNRYLGKCMVGDRPVRVYEVFDGDEFNVRRGKLGSVREFSKGVYDLCSGDAAGAKHIFLQLAHSYPLDGGARYYLYLADRIEHDPSLPCVLNADPAGRGGR